MRRGVVITALSADAIKRPPSEFRIFAYGTTHTRLKKDPTPVLFDEQAAAQVMAAWQRHGADFMIDLEHFSVDDDMLATRPDAPDALGWFKLETRPDGLYAVDVRWTPDGAARLVSGKQRYISPTFTDDADGRPTELVNVALCAMPALCGLDALIAASVRGRAHVARRASVRSRHMTPEQSKAALDVVESGDGAAALALVKELLATAAGGEPVEPAAPDALSPDVPAPDDQKPTDPVAAAVAASVNKALGEFRADLAKLTSTVSALSADAGSRDMNERIKLVGELVELGAEKPVTAYEGKTDDERAKRKLVARLSAEPLDSMRARVMQLRAGRPGQPRPPAPLADDSDEIEQAVLRLSASTLATLKKRNIDPHDFVRDRETRVRRA